jgi:hypothetical protein
MRASFIFLAILLVINAISCSNNRAKVDNQKISDALDTAMAEIRNSRYLEFDSSFALFWKQFALSIKKHDQKSIKSKALDSLVICDTIISTEAFFSKYYSNVFDDYVYSALSDTDRIEYYTYLPLSLEEISSFARNSIIKDSSLLKYREIEIVPELDSKEKNRTVFSFIKTPKGYIFYRYYSVTKRGSKKCCG